MEEDVVTYVVKCQDKQTNLIYYACPIRTFDFVYKAFKDFKI